MKETRRKTTSQNRKNKTSHLKKNIRNLTINQQFVTILVALIHQEIYFQESQKQMYTNQLKRYNSSYVRE